jgi:PAS domain S-box-containing protein
MEDASETTRTAASVKDTDLFRLLVTAVHDYAIYMLDPSGHIQSWNTGAQRFKGYTAEEVLGRHFSIFYTAEDAAAGVPAFALQTAVTAGRFEAQGWRLRKDGTRFWAHVVIDPIRNEAGNLLGFAKITRDLSEQRALEQSLQRSQQEFSLLVQSVTDYAIYMLDTTGNIVSWNAGAERIKGYKADEILGRHFSIFYTPEARREGMPQRALATALAEDRFEQEAWRVRKDGSRFWAHVVLDPIRSPNGRLLGFAKITRDITERREVQRKLDEAREALFQSQKMDAIGKLTGGVAHDFNNLLTVIIGNLDAIQRHLREPRSDIERLKHSAENAMKGAKRAESLTQRLLAFSRQQPLEPKPVDVGRLVSGMSDMLRQTLGEQIAVETALAGDLWRVEVDANQLEVAILNLAVNARDAMPQGGKLTIETANVFLDQTYAEGQVEVVPGQYVMIAVTDNGSGMAPDVQAKAFDPFFTTKEVGHGTGLGLSQVYGFVKQSRGHVKIYSERGEGTTVRIYLPRLHSEEGIVDQEQEPNVARGSAIETIVVVEDDDDVRASSTAMFRDLGYTIFEAANGQAALQLIDQHPEIKLLFTDVGLPGGMNGRQLADAARSRRSDLKVLFTSGYARNAIVHDGRLDVGVELLSKPFTQSSLAARVRDILDAGTGAGRVLVVEDEFLIQMLATQYLEERGLKADVAASATDALSKLRLIPGGVDAVVIDLGLPDRSGDILLREIRAIYPTLPVVLATGHQPDEVRKLVERQTRVAVLSKPYTADTLGAALRSVGIRC